MGILTFFNYSSKELELMAQLKIGWVGWVGVEGIWQHREERAGKIICGCGRFFFFFSHLPLIYMWYTLHQIFNFKLFNYMWCTLYQTLNFKFFWISIMKRLESINTVISSVWWIFGFYWIFMGGQGLLQDSPYLYWYVHAFRVTFFTLNSLLCNCIYHYAEGKMSRQFQIPDMQYSYSSTFSHVLLF